MAKKLKAPAPPKRQTRTIDKKPAFLAAFIAHPDLTAAAKKVGIDRSNHYQWLENDPEYPARFAQAVKQAGQTLKDSAVHWALIGIDEPIVYQGEFQYKTREVAICTLPDGREVRADKLPKDKSGLEIVSTRTITEKYGAPLTVRRRSEGLHARLLKAWLPAEFGDRVSAEISGKDGGPIRLEDERLKKLTDDELAQLIAVAKKLAPDSGHGSGDSPPPPK